MSAATKRQPTSIIKKNFNFTFVYECAIVHACVRTPDFQHKHMIRLDANLESAL